MTSRSETLEDAFARIINTHSRENESNTPDFLLARFLYAALCAFEEVVRGRDGFYGIEHPATALAQRSDDARAKYEELLYAVGNKYPGETRHETALRYIIAGERQALDNLMSDKEIASAALHPKMEPGA